MLLPKIKNAIPNVTIKNHIRIFFLDISNIPEAMLTRKKTGIITISKNDLGITNDPKRMAKTLKKKSSNRFL
jgi:hypothetical protein